LAHEILLKPIEDAAREVFSKASLTWGHDSKTNNRLLRITQNDGLRLIEVTETFLDAEDGEEQTLKRQQGWKLSDALKRLKPGQTLLVTNEGLRLQP
jgi:hypothetical protein